MKTEKDMLDRLLLEIHDHLEWYVKRTKSQPKFILLSERDLRFVDCYMNDEFGSKYKDIDYPHYHGIKLLSYEDVVYLRS